MCYKNLKGEMAKRDVKIEDLARYLNVHRNSISNKIKGITSFSIEEAFAVHKEFFPDLEMEMLFAKE